MPKRPINLSTKLFVVLLILAAVSGLWLYFLIFKIATFNLKSDKADWVYVYPNSEWFTVLDSLDARMTNSRSYWIFGAIEGLNPGLNPKAGAYRIEPNTTVFSLFKRVASGHQTPVRLTFTSRRLPEEMWGQLSRRIMADSVSVAKAMTNRSLLEEIGVPDTTMAYRLIPNTYEVYWTVVPEDLVKKMEEEYRAFWTEERKSKAKELCLTPYEVSILASIVEEESTMTDEYPLIAGLYLNRLRLGIPLQADPTVKFALRDFGLKRILQGHLSVDSPYNTYKYRGLPPGPIRIPSLQAIEGVLGAQKHNFLYMVAKPDFSGYHDFSETLSEHALKASRYRQALNERGIE